MGSSSKESLSMVNSKDMEFLNHMPINTKDSSKMESIMAKENTYGSRAIFIKETTKWVKNVDMESTLA